MSTLTDEQLLKAFADRLDERRGALDYASESLRELRIVNAKLEKAEALKGQFLSNIRNEINNPLNAVQGLAALIHGSADLKPEQVREMAGMIFREISNLSFQMQNVFAAADLEAGEVEPHLGRVDLSTLAAGVVSDFTSRAALKKVDVVLVEKSPGPTLVLLDAAKVRVILGNLLANALEFSPEFGFVEVRVSTEDGEVCIEVRDNGPGIDPANRKRIFDRFEQLSTGTTKNHQGHGLGLSVVKAYAELLEGRIEVRSERGKGSLFSLYLPLKQRAGFMEDGESAEFLFEDAEAY